MKNIVILKIGGHQVDITQQVAFSITKEFKDMSNPTSIINDWSKSITIPFTANNNKLFGHIYDPNRKLIESDSEIIGLYFDPSKKVDFTLLWNNSLLMDGYMKMTSIEHGKGYTINLFGSLGKVFSELKKLTPVLTESITDEKYLIDPIGSNFHMTKELVAESWQKVRNKFKKMPFVNTIGFAPINGGYNDSFDSKTIQLTSHGENGEFISFTDLINELGKYKNTIYDVDSIVGDGLLPRQICDYRSYYTQPYLFVDEMFSLLQDKCEELTDYSLVLHNDWFNVDNPYYAESVMLLKVPEHNTQSQQTYVANCVYRSNYDSSSPRWNQFSVREARTLDITLDPVEDIVSNNTITGIKDGYTLSLKFNLVFKLRLQVDYTMFRNIAPGAGLFANVILVDPTDDTNFIKLGDYVFLAHNNDWPESYYDTYNSVYKITDNEWQRYITIGSIVKKFEDLTDKDWEVINRGEYGLTYREVTLNISGEAALKYYKFRNGVKVKVSFVWIPDASGNVINAGLIPDGLYLYPAIDKSSVINYEVSTNDNRSFDLMSFNDLWDNEFNFFDQCVKYTKMFNLIWDVDNINKRITVMPSATYFNQNKTIVDWTNKVDFGDSYKIEPLIYDAKHYKLGYEESEVGLAETYLKKYGSTCGDKIINTKYNFGEETKNLIENLKTPIVNTSTVFMWPDMYHANVVYRQCAEPMVCLADKENKSVNGFGEFLFYRGLRYFSDLGRSIGITDDTQPMQNTKNYTYRESGISSGGLVVTTYPWLDVVYEGQGYKLGYYFGTPKMRYDVVSEYNSLNTIYDLNWKNYMKEYTSPNNHKITANVYLTPIDFMTFKFNQMVKIGNQVYVVNKICDYNFESKTKCELIKVEDINNYRTLPGIEPELPTAKLVSNNLAAVDATSDLYCVINTNIQGFSKGNIDIVYSTTNHGTLEVSSINDWGTNNYKIFFKQTCFTGKSSGTINIMYHSVHQSSTILMLSVPWTINISQQDDPAIQTDKGWFSVDSITVADLTSAFEFTVTTTVGISESNFATEKKTGAGTLSVKSFVRVSNNPQAHKITVTQSGFNSSGGSGNFKIVYNGETIARIPWHIVVANTSTTGTTGTPKITPITIDTTKNDGLRTIDTVFVDTSNNKLFTINQNNEYEETDTVDLPSGSFLSNYGNNKMLLTYDYNDVSNIVTNARDLTIYKLGVNMHQSIPGGPAYAPSIDDVPDFDSLETVDVSEIVIK